MSLDSEYGEFNEEEEEQSGGGFPSDFDFLSLVSKHKDYYKILELEYDANDEAIRSNYIRLALKWHPDKRKDEDSSTSRFQEINEAYKVLSDPTKRREYDKQGVLYIIDDNSMEYFNQYKSLILTCNGLGVRRLLFIEALLSGFAVTWLVISVRKWVAQGTSPQSSAVLRINLLIDDLLAA